MADTSRNPQLELWRGEFGHAYAARNQADEAVVNSLTRMWSRMLEGARPSPRSVLEVGTNVGLNLRALRRITDAELFGVEPNDKARGVLVADGVLDAAHAKDGTAEALPFETASMDLAFTSGVLIHVHPDRLAQSCKEIYRVSRRYVLCSEYYAKLPRQIAYRGLDDDYLFLRDFGAFWLETCPNLRLLDYGFFWTGAGAADDLTWWLLEKPQ
jgi:pseudaminic acid biosynthesis-associated methylase